MNSPDQAAAVDYDGMPVVIAGKTYILPAMSAKTARRHWERIEKMQQPAGLPLVDQLDLTADLVHECLLRNYPELARNVVDDHIDVSNYAELSAMVFGRGAWLRWVEAQELLRGNWLAPQAGPTDGTGVLSTPASPPPLAGDTATSMS
jgi:nitroimidazol reductase NimA-like FMN-containing flavoprotein (pyridoxamine 5'-phosphate oxidase superfamily)